MGKSIYDLRELLCEELENMTEQKSLSGDKLKVIDMLTHSIKSIDTIVAMENSGYSNEGGSYANAGGSYAGGSYANAGGNSNAYGSYAGGNSNARGNSNAYMRGNSNAYRQGGGGRSRDDAKAHLMRQLEEMMGEVHSEKEREALQRCMEQMN